jgi:hypothetical protein
MGHDMQVKHVVQPGKPRAGKATGEKGSHWPELQIFELDDVFVSYKAAAGLPLAARGLNHMQARLKFLIGAPRHVDKAAQKMMLVECLSEQFKLVMTDFTYTDNAFMQTIFMGSIHRHSFCTL